MAENPITLGDQINVLADDNFLHGIESLITPNTVFLSLAKSIPMGLGTTYLPPQVTAHPSEMDWIIEGEQKPIGDVSFQRQSLTPKKISIITPWTEEIDEAAFISMRAVIQEAILARARVEIDSQLWNGTADTDQKGPLGLLNQSGFLSYSFNTKADLGLDCKAMIREMWVNNTMPNYFVMHPAHLAAIQEIETTDKLPKYASTLGANPSLFGVPIVTTTNLPYTYGATDDVYTAPIILAKWSDVWIGRANGSLKLIDQATLTKSDSSTINLAQEDMVALRYVARISSPVVRRAESVCIMNDVVA